MPRFRWVDVNDEVLERALQRDVRSRRFLGRRKHKVTRQLTEFGLIMEQHYRERLGEIRRSPRRVLLAQTDLYGLDINRRLVKLTRDGEK